MSVFGDRHSVLSGAEWPLMCDVWNRKQQHAAEPIRPSLYGPPRPLQQQAAASARPSICGPPRPLQQQAAASARPSIYGPPRRMQQHAAAPARLSANRITPCSPNRPEPPNHLE
eukprot:350242-Chlamydomonas_euryale.AAC.16